MWEIHQENLEILRNNFKLLNIPPNDINEENH